MRKWVIHALRQCYYVSRRCFSAKKFIFSEIFLKDDPPVVGGSAGSGGNNPVLTRLGFGAVARKLVFLLIGILRP
jgi:hypothetical protein